MTVLYIAFLLVQPGFLLQMAFVAKCPTLYRVHHTTAAALPGSPML